MFLTRKRAFARAGLLGNPSDGYHGKTVSISVRNYWAEVVLYEWDSVEIVDLVEKPSPREAPSNLAIAARYVLSPAIFQALAETKRGKGGEIQLTDALRAVIRSGGRAYGVRLRPGERRYDIGNFEAYFEAFVAFALADRKFGPALRRHLLEALDVSHP